jgi:HEAT repeat protein
MAVYIFGKWFGHPNIEQFKAQGNIRRLIQAMSYKSYRTRMEAIKTLLEIGTPAIEALCTAIKYKRRSSVVWNLIQALADIGDARAVEPLIALLHRSRKYKYRGVNIVDALGKINDGRAADGLVMALKDKNRSVRQYAVDALNKPWMVYQNGQMVEALVATLNDARRDVREVVVQALGNIDIGDARAVEHSLLP